MLSVKSVGVPTKSAALFIYLKLCSIAAKNLEMPNQAGVSDFTPSPKLSSFSATVSITQQQPKDPLYRVLMGAGTPHDGSHIGTSLTGLTKAIVTSTTFRYM